MGWGSEISTGINCAGVLAIDGNVFMTHVGPEDFDANNIGDALHDAEEWVIEFLGKYGYEPDFK